MPVLQPRPITATVHKIMKVEAAPLRLAAGAVEKVDSLTMHMLNKLVEAAVIMCEVQHTLTLTPREIQAAVQVTLAGELRTDAVTKGVTNLTRANMAKDAMKGVRQEKRAGIAFPVGLVDSYIRYLVPRLKSDMRVSPLSAVYLATVLEYIVQELTLVARARAEDAGLKTITAAGLAEAIAEDEELRCLGCA